MATKPEFVTPREAAAIIECHYETVYDWVRRGILPAQRPIGTGPGRRIKIRLVDVESLKRNLVNGGLVAPAVGA